MLSKLTSHAVKKFGSQETYLESLQIGALGSLSINIPIIRIGQGSPILGLVCSVHGDEVASLYIIRKFLSLLELFSDFHGTVLIIPSANPVAQSILSRTTPHDCKDLNRVGAGSTTGTITQQMAAHLIQHLKQCDLVVSLHEFEMHTPTTAVFMNAGTYELKRQVLKAINAFNPKMIWVIDSERESDSQYLTTLNTAFAKSGVVEFPIETTKLAYINEAEIKDAALGIIRVAEHLGMLNKSIDKKPLQMAPAFIRQEIRSEISGIWEPNSKCKLLSTTKRDMLMGSLSELSLLDTKDIYLEKGNVPIQLRHREFVSSGKALYSIGIPADNIINKYLNDEIR